MFSEYQLSAALGEADAFVPIAKMKNHSFMGITLCLKNLFGLPPIPPHGRLRNYFYHVIRLSYALPIAWSPAITSLPPMPVAPT
jgi:hypothetical protein